MFEGTTFIGLDVHKRSIAVAIRQPGMGRVEEERLPHQRSAVARWARRWKHGSGGKLVCAYEAGACATRCSASSSSWGSCAKSWR